MAAVKARLHHAKYNGVIDAVLDGQWITPQNNPAALPNFATAYQDMGWVIEYWNADHEDWSILLTPTEYAQALQFAKDRQAALADLDALLKPVTWGA